jgi:hypothetical protein
MAFTLCYRHYARADQHLYNFAIGSQRHTVAGTGPLLLCALRPTRLPGASTVKHNPKFIRATSGFPSFTDSARTAGQLVRQCTKASVDLGRLGPSEIRIIHTGRKVVTFYCSLLGL